MMLRKFVVSGYRPDNGINNVMRAFDLGMEGAYIKFRYLVTLTVDNDSTPAQLAAQITRLRDAFNARNCAGAILEEVVYHDESN